MRKCSRKEEILNPKICDLKQKLNRIEEDNLSFKFIIAFLIIFSLFIILKIRESCQTK